jgi:hypothetical protein
VSRSGSTYYSLGYKWVGAERRLEGERDSLRSLGSSQLAAPADMRAVTPRYRPPPAVRGRAPPPYRVREPSGEIHTARQGTAAP